jgi:putative zinc finger protein
VSHLGERLTALVDGELEHDERDRAYAHLAGCAACRAEAEALRRLKSELRSLDEAVPSGDLLTRLRTLDGAMGDTLGGPDPGAAAGEPRTQPGGTRVSARRAPRPGRRAPAGTRPTGHRPRRGPSAVRGRYLAMGAATLAVLGMGAASVAASAPPERLPQVAPALERLAVEYVLMTTGGGGPTPAATPKATPKATPEATQVAERGRP